MAKNNNNNSSLKNGISISGRANSSWIFLMERSMLSDEVTSPLDFVKLRHPRSGLGAIFLFSPDNSIVQEVFSFAEKRSWFVNDSVRQNGKICFSTPVDPLFLVLPYLKKSKEEGKTVPMEDLLIDNMFPDMCRLLKSSLLKNINSLADRKGPEDLNAWMYNEEKTLKWLCKKTEKVAQILFEKKINISQSAVSEHFVKSSRSDSCNIGERSMSDKSHLKYAHGLVSEYLTDDLSQKLLSHLGLPPDNSNKTCVGKRKSSEPVTKAGKKFKLGEEVANESKTVEKHKVVSSKEKAKIVKTTSGLRSVMSYFKKK